MKEAIPLQGTIPAAQSSPVLSVHNLSVVLGHQQVLDSVTFDVYPGELLAILGSSGSGKTTLLNAVAGFIAPSSGRIMLSGQLVSQPGKLQEPEKRHLGMVFQSYALWPQMTVLGQCRVSFTLSGEDQSGSQAPGIDHAGTPGARHIPAPSPI